MNVRPLTADDADALTACFRRCYDDSYVVGFFYDPSAIRERIADGRLCSVVAVAPDGQIVGHMALTVRHPQARTVELGNTVVDPDYRGHGLASRLAAALVDVCRTRAAVGFHHYPTTAHAIMQKLAVEAGGVETGVMLAYIPAGTEYKELSGAAAAQRLAVVVVYQPLAPAPPRRVFLPPRWADTLQTLYRRAGLERQCGIAQAAADGSRSELAIGFDARRGLVRIDVARIGADLPQLVGDSLRERAAAVTHVDLPLGDAGAPAAAEALRAQRFLFCALLPEFAEQDVLRLQHLREPPAMPDLVYPEARELLARSLSDA